MKNLSDNRNWKVQIRVPHDNINQNTFKRWNRQKISELSNELENERIVQVFGRRLEDEDENGSDGHSTDQVYLDIAEDSEYVENTEPNENEEGANSQIENEGLKDSFEIGECEQYVENNAFEGVKNNESYNEDVYYLDGMKIVREPEEEGYEDFDANLVNSTGITLVENDDETTALNTSVLDENVEPLGEIINATEEFRDDNLFDELSTSVNATSVPATTAIDMLLWYLYLMLLWYSLPSGDVYRAW